MEKWVCNKCGNERTDKPKKNEICPSSGCKGRFQYYTQCRKCGEWFRSHEGKTFCDHCKQSSPQYRRIGMVNVVCFQCGKAFPRFKGNVKGKKQFCGIDCLREFEKTRWIDRSCKECGKQFMVYRSAIEHTNASGNYCSRSCYDKSMSIEGSVSYKGGFERVKREHFSGVQFCAICGTTKRIHIHHIIPFRLTQDNGLDNLVPLCIRHHKQFENVTLPFINAMDDMSAAKFLLNSIIRNRQQETMQIISSIVRQWRQDNVSENA